jgi:hypothetical protein
MINPSVHYFHRITALNFRLSVFQALVGMHGFVGSDLLNCKSMYCIRKVNLSNFK